MGPLAQARASAERGEGQSENRRQRRKQQKAKGDRVSNLAGTFVSPQDGRVRNRIAGGPRVRNSDSRQKLQSAQQT
jgi:hypothetical protein